MIPISDANPSVKIGQLVKGDYYSTGEYFTDVGIDSAKTFVLENNSENKKYVVQPQKIRSEGKAIIKKYMNVEISGGSNPTQAITNKKPSSKKNTTANAYIEATISNPGSRFNDKLLGSNCGGIRSGGASNVAANILEPEDNLAIEIINKSSNKEDISINIDFMEIKN